MSLSLFFPLIDKAVKITVIIEIETLNHWHDKLILAAGPPPPSVCLSLPWGLEVKLLRNKVLKPSLILQ